MLDSNLFFYIPNIHIINRYAVTFCVAATCLDLCAVNTEHPSPRLSYIRVWANIDNPICGWSRYVKISYTVPSIEACLFNRSKRARIGEENRWNNYFSPDKTLSEIKRKKGRLHFKEGVYRSNAQLLKIACHCCCTASFMINWFKIPALESLQARLHSLHWRYLLSMWYCCNYKLQMSVYHWLWEPPEKCLSGEKKQKL